MRWRVSPAPSTVTAVPATSRRTIAESLRLARQRLIDAGIDRDEAMIEARVLHQEALGIPPTKLLTSLRDAFPPEGEAALDRLLQRRLAREPLAYVVGRREFYGLAFRTDHRALIPRPETELLVEATIRLTRDLGLRSPHIVDVGTGTGAIAITLARSLPDARITAIDSSSDALALAAENVRLHRLESHVDLLAGDLLAPLHAPADVIVANLPYIPENEIATLAPEVRDFEPHTALFGGPDGLDCYRALLAQAPTHLRRPGAIAIEIGQGQGAAVRKLVAHIFPNATITCTPDYAGIDRVITAIIPN